MYDITERKLAEQTLIKSERRERGQPTGFAIDDMKNTFLAAVSHELRQSTHPILGLALTLERQERSRMTTARTSSQGSPRMHASSTGS